MYAQSYIKNKYVIYCIKCFPYQSFSSKVVCTNCDLNETTYILKNKLTNIYLSKRRMLSGQTYNATG